MRPFGRSLPGPCAPKTGDAHGDSRNCQRKTELFDVSSLSFFYPEWHPESIFTLASPTHPARQSPDGGIRRSRDLVDIGEIYPFIYLVNVQLRGDISSTIVKKGCGHSRFSHFKKKHVFASRPAWSVSNSVHFELGVKFFFFDRNFFLYGPN